MPTRKNTSKQINKQESKIARQESNQQTSKPNTIRKLQKRTSQSKKQPDSDQLGGVVDVGPRIAHRQGS